MPRRNILKLTFDDKDLKKRLSKVSAAVRSEAVEKGLRAGQNTAIAWIKIYMDKVLNRQTGNMINSVQEDEISISNVGWVTFGPHVIQARIHELGGVIKPIKGPYLVFKGSDGKLVFTKSVTIPARPYMRPAMDERSEDILKSMGDTIGSIIDNNWSSL